jgi:hypothetical protein
MHGYPRHPMLAYYLPPAPRTPVGGMRPATSSASVWEIHTEGLEQERERARDIKGVCGTVRAEGTNFSLWRTAFVGSRGPLFQPSQLLYGLGVAFHYNLPLPWPFKSWI